MKHWFVFFLLFAGGALPLAAQDILPGRLAPAHCRAVDKGGSIVFSWRMEKDSSHALYLIERSVNGIYYQPVGEQHSTGGFNSIYEFTDAQLPPDAATLYYRLRLVDAQKQEYIGQVVTVMLRAREQKTLVLFPNPAYRSVTARLYYEAEEAIKIRVLDLSGRIRWAKELQLQNGFNSFLVNLESFDPGTYIIQCFSSRYELIAQERFVKMN
jgi:Secretion system C-terminal sorting domain